MCLDINECAENGTCDQDCTNTDGSFMCSCYNGYELDESGRSCNGLYIIIDNYQYYCTFCV